MGVLTLCILLLAAGEIAYSQRAGNIGSCEKLMKDDFGRSDTFSADGIVAEILQEDGMTAGQVRIDGFKIVCEVAGLMRGTISSISVIIAYQYTNTSLMSSPLNRTEQFQMDCVNGLNDNTASFSPPMILLGGGVRTLEPNGTLETQLNEKCGICADPAIIPDIDNTVEIDTHCFRMYTYN